MMPVTRRHTLASIAGVALLALACVLAPGSASAQNVSARVTVRAIVANHGGAGVDPSLTSWTDRLQRQFAAHNFDSFALHGAQTFTLTTGNPATIDIPGDRTASIELLSVANGTYTLQIQVPGGSTTVRMPPDQILFVGGPNVPGGTLILMVDS